MKFELNKETLMKHRFWIVLGVAFCVILTGMLLASSDDMEKKRAEIENVLKKGAPADKYQAPLTIEVRQNDAKRAKDLESHVWSLAYQEQEPLYTWANGLEEQFPFRKGRFANAIKIDSLADPKSWPADSPTLIHGVLTTLSRDWFEIKDRTNKQVKIYLTQNILDLERKGKNVTLGGKDIPWGPAIGQFVNNKVFAVTYQVGKYFNDPLTISEQKAFGESYKSQIHPILEIVDPLDVNGNGVVQLRDWLFNKNDLPPDNAKFIRFVGVPWDPINNFSDEAWVAQENLWIQKEIYQIIRSANDKISKFEGKGGKERSPKAYVFKNSYFELSLMLNADNSVIFKIKNILNKRQPIDLSFSVHMDETRKPEILKISNVPLAPAGDKAGKDSYVQTFPHKKEEGPRKGIYSVEQVLSWETAAVKRIDHISIGSASGGDISHSQRTFPEPLRPLQMAGAKAAPVPAAAPGNPAGGPGNPVAPPAPAPPMGGKVGAAFAHGLWPDRYVEVSEQSRRIPVAIVVIVDQAHVDRVLTAFNNSKLRFLDTQVLLNLYPGSLQPLVGGRGSLAAGGDKGGTGGGAQSLETNMEMVIYGIMTLYQRYPPRSGGSAVVAEIKKS